MVFSALSSSLDSLLAATSILVVEDIYRRHLRPDGSPPRTCASDGVDHRRPRRADLAAVRAAPDDAGRTSVLHGCIRGQHDLADRRRPVPAQGEHGRRHLRHGAGSAAGLYGYFAIGFYVAALVGAAVSMICVVLGTDAQARGIRLGTSFANRRPDQSEVARMTIPLRTCSALSLSRAGARRGRTRLSCSACCSGLAEETLMVNGTGGAWPNTARRAGTRSSGLRSPASCP